VFKILIVAVLLAVAGVLAYAATKPDTFKFRREALMAATPEQIFPLINDLHRFNTWNPFNKPGTALRYNGPTEGPGASFEFAGDSNTGKGSLAITASQAARSVAMQLIMLTPMEAHNDILFELVPQGATTRVSWTMTGQSNLLSKLIGLFIDMDKMVGGEFQKGLSSLKAQIEHPQAAPPGS
jgi:hypothetical protein